MLHLINLDVEEILQESGPSLVEFLFSIIIQTKLLFSINHIFVFYDLVQSSSI